MLGLLTNGNIEVQKNKIKHLKLKNLFHTICIARETGKEKPHKHPFKKIIEDLGVKPIETMIIGDNPLHDFSTPNELGMTTVRILRGEFKTESVGEEGADYIIENYSELLELLDH